jgi:DNA repair protein RecO (recombination protein O)
MHHIYHTHGFIIRSSNTGEANKFLVIYTKELGLVRAVAQGIRHQKSKLRFALQDLSYARIDLVRGRDVWRVTSAATIELFALLRQSKESLLIMYRISQLLERISDGEEPQESIFSELIDAFFMLNQANIPEETRTALELHLVLRSMSTLGYVGDNVLLSQYIATPFREVACSDLLRDKALIVSHINNALKESQL